MLKLLQFDPHDDTKRYVLCYQSLCFAKAPLARNELRAHGALLTKLESIGMIANPGRAEGDVALYKNVHGGRIVVDGEEYGLLERFLVAFVPDVHRSMSREMDGVLAWLAAAPSVPEPMAEVVVPPPPSPRTD